MHPPKTEPAAPREPRVLGALLAGILIVFFLLVYLRVKPTNFGGFDEWVYLTLGSQGIVSLPRTNRPFALVWTLPALWLEPASFEGYYWIHFAYLFGGALLVARIVRLVSPADALLAYMAAAFSLVWAPASLWRLDTVMTSLGSGVVCGGLGAGLLFVAAWRRGSLALGLAAAALAFVVSRSYEGLVPLLAAVPLLLLGSGARQGNRLRLVAAWWGAIAVAVVLVLWPRLSGQSTYQFEQFQLELRPAAMGARLLDMLRQALQPLLQAPPPGASRAAAATAVFLAGCVLARRSRPAAGPLARVAALGLLMTVVLSFPFALADMWGDAANRAQILAAPGIALLLAALARALGMGRAWPSALLAGWVVFLGAAYTFRQQDVWDVTSFYPKQRRSLVGLVRAAPDVQPHTLFALLDTTWAWPASFPFQHAVSFVYQGRAAGSVAAVPEPLYPAEFGPEGVRVTPVESIRAPWRVAPELYRYDEVVVVVGDADGVRLLREWPAAGLPPLPPGARYEPLTRIRRLGVPIPERRVIGE